MKTKTSDLTGPALDWAVATCEGWEYDDVANAKTSDRKKQYSTSWAQGGPIIEREFLSLIHRSDRSWTADNFSDPTRSQHLHFGPTILIAAMRCYVASKLGDEVEVPDELVS